MIGPLLGRTSCGLDGVPSVCFDVEGVEVVQVFTAIAASEDVDLMKGWEEVGGVHVAWAWGGASGWLSIAGRGFNSCVMGLKNIIDVMAFLFLWMSCWQKHNGQQRGIIKNFVKQEISWTTQPH